MWEACEEAQIALKACGHFNIKRGVAGRHPADGSTSAGKAAIEAGRSGLGAFNKCDNNKFDKCDNKLLQAGRGGA